MVIKCSLVFLLTLTTAVCGLSTPVLGEQRQQSATETKPVADAEHDKKQVLPPQNAAELEALLSKLNQRIDPEKPNLQLSHTRPLLAAMALVANPEFAPLLTKQLLFPSTWGSKLGCVLALANMNTGQSTAALRQFLNTTPLIQSENQASLEKAGVRGPVDARYYELAVRKAARVLVERGEFASIVRDLTRFELTDDMALAGKPGLEALIRLVEDTKKHSASLPDQLKRSFSQVRSPECLGLLREVATGETMPEYARQGSLAALAEGWGAEEYPTLIAVAKGARRYDVRETAYYFAAKLKPQATRDELLRLLKDPQTTMRSCGARLLGMLADPTVTAQLEELLDDQSDDVRLAALEGLWSLDHTYRQVKWSDPRFEKEYQKHMRSHPKP